jgi:phosphoenolpyruvate---glycerone phosphotransferase subunit DhaL
VVRDDTPLAAVETFERVLEATERAQKDLDLLDAVAGDGDLGVSMVLGWRAVVADLAASPPASAGAAFRQAAESFASVGGTAGPLWGTALLRAGRSLGDAQRIGLAEMAAAADAAVAGLCERGRCQEGMKTVVDAMGPAARALEQAAQRGAATREGLTTAAEAASDAAAATALLTPQRGRAARAPERSRGHVDAGAAACAIFWSAVADCGGPA